MLRHALCWLIHALLVVVETFVAVEVMWKALALSLRGGTAEGSKHYVACVTLPWKD